MKTEKLSRPLSREEVADILCKHYGALKSMARRYYNDRDNILDLVQDTILKVLSSECLEGVATKEELFGLCFIAMRSIRYNDFRRQSVMQCLPIRSEDDYGASGDIVDYNFVHAIEVVRAMGADNVKIAAAIYKAEGYSESEIAEIQGVPLGTVKSRIFNGRKELSVMS